MSHPDGGPAFPQVYDAHHWPGPGEPKGMSLRDYFAGMALQGMLAANPGKVPGMTADNVDQIIAREAYASADAMLKQREQP